MSSIVAGFKVKNSCYLLEHCMADSQWFPNIFLSATSSKYKDILACKDVLCFVTVTEYLPYRNAHELQGHKCIH